MLLSQLLWPTLKLKLYHRWNEALFIKLGLFWGVLHNQRNKEKQGCELKKVETLQQADGTVLHYAIWCSCWWVMMGGAWFRLIHSATGNKMAVSCWQSFTAAEVRNWWFFLGDFNAEGMQRSIVSEITQHGRLLDQSCVSLSVCLCVCKPVFCKANSNVSSCSRVYQQLYPLYQHFWAARATPNPYCPRQPNANDAGAQSVTDSHPTANQPPPTSHHPQPAAPLPSLMHPPFTLQIWLFSQQRIQTNHWF